MKKPKAEFTLSAKRREINWMYSEDMVGEWDCNRLPGLMQEEEEEEEEVEEEGGGWLCKVLVCYCHTPIFEFCHIFYIYIMILYSGDETWAYT
jgi:hypothetical protein